MRSDGDSGIGARFLVAIPSTFRSSSLSRLVASLNSTCEAADGHLSVIVVDNTTEGGREKEVLDLVTRRVCIRYVHEPASGVVHARNRALKEFREEKHSHLVFLDDDQLVAPDWLAHLTIRADATPSAVISGLVEYRIPTDVVDPYVVEYYDTVRRWPEGERLRTTGTGNCVIPRKVFEKMSWPLFSTAHNEVGGEDTEFFLRLSRCDVDILWTNTVTAYESVEPERAVRGWIRARMRRTGTVRAKMQGSRLRALFEGGARVVAGSIVLGGHALLHARRGYKGDAMLYSGLGFLDHAAGGGSIVTYGS